MARKYALVYNSTGDDRMDEICAEFVQWANEAYEDGKAGKPGYPINFEQKMAKYKSHLGRDPHPGAMRLLQAGIQLVNTAYRDGVG